MVATTAILQLFKFIFTNNKGFVESQTLVVTNQYERDNFMTTYLNKFICEFCTGCKIYTCFEEN
jgi:hypothetical protein